MTDGEIVGGDAFDALGRLQEDFGHAAISAKDYPTGKPAELYRQMLQPPVLEDGERLLEPFCGSGSGAAVAAERGLNYWGVDANAVDKAREQLEQPRIGQVTL